MQAGIRRLGKTERNGDRDAPINAAASVHRAHVTHQAREEHGSRDAHAGHSVAMFRDKFFVSLLLTIPTLVWGHMLQRAFGYTPPHVPGSD